MCRFCSSINVVKFGFNSLKNGPKQRYLCKDCRATFAPTSELVKGNRFDERGAEDIQHLKLEELRDFRRSVKRMVYPGLDFELHPQAEYDTETFLDLLAHIATTHDFMENGSKTFVYLKGSGPSADDLLWHIKNLDRDEVERKFTEVLTHILNSAGPLGLSRRKRFDVAIDIHDWLYYGKKAPGVLKTKPTRGTSRAFKFVTLSILKGGFRFVVLAMPLKKRGEVVEEVERLLKFAVRWIKIRRVYLDGEFYQVKVVRLLKRRGLKFVIRARINQWLRGRVERAKPPAVIHHTMRSKAGAERVNILAVKGRRELKDEEGASRKPRREKQYFVTNIEMIHEEAERLAEDFGKRWGIETSYRVMKNFRPRTASPNHVVRLFLFMFSVVLHDCWVLANLTVGQAVLRFVPSKPFITAKMFGMVLYIPGLPFDRG